MSVSGHSPLSKARSAALVSALLAVLVHANALQNQFAYDDVHILTEHEEMNDVSNLPRLMAEPYWPGDFSKELGLWRPGTTLKLSQP